MTKTNLKELREKIDKTDRELVKILAERFVLTKEVGEYKKSRNLKALAKKREVQIFKKREKWAKELDLDPILIKKIFTMVIKEVKENHRKIRKSDGVN